MINLMRKCETKPIRVFVDYSEDEPDCYFGSSFCVAEASIRALRYAGYEMMSDYYRTEVEPVAGAVEFLHRMKGEGMKLGVSTATPRNVAALALERTGILPLLDGFVSTKDVGCEKIRPDVFVVCAEQMGVTERDELVVFEDAYYSIRTLKEHGFTVVGIHDRFTPDAEWEMLAPLCDRLIEDYRELL